MLSSQEVVDFVSERLKKQSETGKLALSKICEEVKGFWDNYSLLHVIVLYNRTLKLTNRLIWHFTKTISSSIICFSCLTGVWLVTLLEMVQVVIT